VLPALLGDSPTGRDRVIQHAGRLAIRQDRWKLIPGLPIAGTNPAKGSARGQDILYDLSQDPGETKDVAKQHPDKVKQLADQLQQIRDSGRSRPLGARVEESAPASPASGISQPATPNSKNPPIP
jgi:arylsulfatase A-like enzyme